jgi:tetratricopeptide (TPR) repeat protein
MIFECFALCLPLLSNWNFLLQMFLHALLVRPWLSPFITLKLMKLTMTHGLSFLAPLTFATYGMLCIRLSDRDAALRYGELGLELLEKFQVREYIARVFAAYYACIYPWKYRARDGLDRLLYAHRAGLQTGDVEFSCLCANLWSYIAIDCGLPLDAIELQWTNFQGTMKSHRQASLFRGSVPCLQAIQFYQGKNVDFSETEALWQYCIDNKIRSTANGIRWSRAKTAFLFQDMDRADELVYDANVSKNGWSIPPTPEIVHVSFLNGMVAFAMVNYQSRDKTVRPKRRTRRQYINEGKSMIRSIKKYAHWCPANFLDKKFLLKAELAAVSGQSDKAMEQYISAIALAKDNRNLFVQALANERAGRYCYTVLHQSQEAVSYFLQALFVYAEWAAHRKVDHLRAELKTMYSPEDYNKWFL